MRYDNLGGWFREKKIRKIKTREEMSRRRRVKRLPLGTLIFSNPDQAAAVSSSEINGLEFFSNRQLKSVFNDT